MKLDQFPAEIQPYLLPQVGESTSIAVTGARVSLRWIGCSIPAPNAEAFS